MHYATENNIFENGTVLKGFGKGLMPELCLFSTRNFINILYKILLHENNYEKLYDIVAFHI